MFKVFAGKEHVLIRNLKFYRMGFIYNFFGGFSMVVFNITSTIVELILITVHVYPKVLGMQNNGEIEWYRNVLLVGTYRQ